MILKKFSEEPVYIQKIEETEKYQISKQKFSYNCEVCGKLYTRELYFYIKHYKYKKLLCKECLVTSTNQRRQKTCTEKYGADNIRKSEKYSCNSTRRLKTNEFSCNFSI